MSVRFLRQQLLLVRDQWEDLSTLTLPMAGHQHGQTAQTRSLRMAVSEDCKAATITEVLEAQQQAVTLTLKAVRVQRG
jgi:hypothetical protein